MAELLEKLHKYVWLKRAHDIEIQLSWRPFPGSDAHGHRSFGALLI